MRSQSGLFVIEGTRLCFDAYKSGVEFETVFVTENFIEKFNEDVIKISNSAKETYMVTEEIMKHICDTVNPQGIVCVCKNVVSKFDIKENLKFTVLVDVQDPANVGTISRTAEALGIDALIVCGGCDIYNPKALRASMGALFRLPVLQMNTQEMFEFLESNNIKSFASTPRDTAKELNKTSFDGKCAMLIGNEANGLSDEIIEKCETSVTIQMLGRAESLNAAAAASILMYEMMRGSL